MIEPGIPLKLVALLKITLTAINSRIRYHFSELFEMDTGQDDPLCDADTRSIRQYQHM